MPPKSIVIFLLLVNVASIFCTSTILLYQIFLHELATEFCSKGYPLTCVEVSMSQYHSLNFSNLDESVKEVEIQGELMDIYKMEIKENSVKLFVRLDGNDTDAKNILKKINHQNSSPQKSIYSFFCLGTICEKKSTDKFCSPEIPFLSGYYSLQIIPSPFITTAAQPPDQV